MQVDAEPRQLLPEKTPAPASPHHRARRPEPEGFDSKIVQSHFLGKQACYDRMTCLPVLRASSPPRHHSRHHGHREAAAQPVPSDECPLNQVRDLYDCCFFHSIGALEGGSNRSPEGCTPDKWPEDTRVYKQYAALFPDAAAA